MMKTKELAHYLTLFNSRWSGELAKWVLDNEFTGLDFLAFVEDLSLFDAEAEHTLNRHLPHELQHLRLVLFYAHSLCLWPWAPRIDE